MAKLLFDHVVVLMLENPLFEHLFGYLGVGEGLAGVNATNYLSCSELHLTDTVRSD